MRNKLFTQRLLGALAAGCMIGAAFVFRPQAGSNPTPPFSVGYMLFIGGALCLWLALRHIAPQNKTLPAPEKIRVRWWRLWLGVAGLLVVINANVWEPLHEATISHHAQMLAFVIGVYLIVTAFGRVRFQRVRWQNFLLVGVVLLALLLRVVDLEYGIHRFVDELHFIEAVADFRYFGDQPILLQHGSIAAFAWHFPYVQHLVTEILQPSLTAIRLPSAIFGTLQVLGVYWLAARFFGRTVALSAALLLATLPIHLHFSRIGLNNIADPTFGLFALVFLVRGIYERRQVDFALAGACLGMTQYFYEGGRAFYAPFVLLWLGWLFIFRRRDMPALRHLAILGGVFVLVALPLYVAWYVNGLDFLPRYHITGDQFTHFTAALERTPQPLQAFWLRFQTMFFAYFNQPIYDPFYRSALPLVLPALVPLFLLGLAGCMLHVRRAGAALLFWWLVGVAAANAFVSIYLNSPRYIVALPALAMLIAYGLQQIAHLLKRGRRVLVIALVLAGSAYQAAYYFTTYVPEYYERQFYYEYDVFTKPMTFLKDFDDMIFRVVQLPPQTDVHIISAGIWGQHSYGKVLAYYGRYQPQDLRLHYMYASDLSETYLQTLPPNRNLAFFVAPEDAQTQALLGRYFELGVARFSPYDVPHDKQFALFLVTR